MEETRMKEEQRKCWRQRYKSQINQQQGVLHLILKESWKNKVTIQSTMKHHLSKLQVRSSLIRVMVALIVVAQLFLSIQCLTSEDLQAGSISAVSKDVSSSAELKPIDKSSVVAPEVSKEAPKEVLLSAEASEAYAPPVNPAEQSSLATNASSDANVEQQSEQRAEAEPAVSGLVGQDDGTSQQTIETDSKQQQTVVGSGEQSRQQQVDPDQQLIAATGGLQTESESTRLRSGSAENDVLADDNFGRKTAGDQLVSGQQQSAEITEQSQQSQTANYATKSGKGRSLKRAFAGHMGVFGRKRTQTGEERAPSGSQHEQVAPMNLAAREHHYYYQSTTSTRSPTTRSKLKSADYPDYSEILVQPEQRQQESKTTVFAGSEQRADDQMTEQVQVQVGDSEVTGELAEIQQQQQQQEAVTGADLSQQTISEPQQEQRPETPFIRLSNIATINSTSNSGNSSGGEVKLMRIYVIDLDQKLVVSNNQPGASAGDIRGAQFAQSETPTTIPVDSYQKDTQSTYATSASTTTTTTTTTTTAPQYATSVDYPTSSHGTNQRAYEPNDGYVLLDKQMLQANLSQLAMAAMNPAQQQQQQDVQSAYQRLNYSTPNLYLANYMATNNYSAPNVYLASHPASNYSAQPASYSVGPEVQHVPVYTPYLVYENPVSEHVQANQTASPQQVQYVFNENQAKPSQYHHYEQQSVYSTHPSAHNQVQQQAVQQPPIPQYIAPQYKVSNHLEQEHEQQQLAPHQHDYGRYNNYTSKAPLQLYVQASAIKQQEKLRANSSQSNGHYYENTVYKQQPVEIYQHSQVNEPAQEQVAQYETIHKGGIDQWKPVEYTAPSGLNTQSHNSVQYQGGSRNRNKDHEVVSLNGGQSNTPQVHHYESQHTNYSSNPYEHTRNKHYEAPQSSKQSYSFGQQESEQVHDNNAPYSPSNGYSSQSTDSSNSPVQSMYQYNSTNSQEVPYSSQQYKQIEQHQYGSASLSAYGNPKQRPSVEQSSEAPRIPQAGEVVAQQGYRQQSSHKQPPSAYLSVSGPPVGNGVYESDESSAPHRDRPQQRPAKKAPNQRSKAGRAKYGQSKFKEHGDEYAQLEPNQYHADPEQTDESSGHAHHHVYHNEPQRPSQPALGYYRPPVPNPSKGLLSWETISSVASGAAKRLPSLSSILMPFAGQPKNPPLYPAYQTQALYAQHPAYTRSAHYDADVSAFHRPYPQRYASESALKVADSSKQTDAKTNYLNDLHSSSSDSGGESALQDSSVDSDIEEEIADSDSGIALSSNQERPKRPENLTEIITDLADIDPASEGASKQTKGRQVGSKNPRPISEGPKTSDVPDYTQEVRLPGIEQQIAKVERPKQGKSNRRKPKRPKTSQDSSYVEAAILDDHRLPINLNSLPVDQQQLLMGQSSLKRPAASVHFPTPDDASSIGRPPRFNEIYGPGGHQMRPVSSVQIGQYKITPQTQFVHNILEPSRQMFGQYFKQYINQLGQFAGR